MSNRRTFIAVVGGKKYEIPTTLAILAKAEQVSKTSLMEATASGKLGVLLQGALAIGLCNNDASAGDAELEAAFIEAGEQCDFSEAQQNYIAFLTAMMPEVKSSSKNVTAENVSPGRKSNDLATASSS